MTRILLVEDDKLLLRVYENILSAKNYQLTVVENGAVALVHMLEGGFDLILLDLRLPQIDGIQILEKLKKTKPKKANGPIVVLSNVNDEKTIKKAMSLGAVGYLTKDQIDLTYLANEVENYLKQKNLY